MANSKSSKFHNWFEIAKTGKFPQGDLTTDIFDNVVKNFDPAYHEPPIVLGHIRPGHNDKAAMGWISGVKRVGDRLLAKASQIWDKFDSQVREGRFKKRSFSIRFNKDASPYLHHLAFLGSSTPAVQGMPNVYSGDFNFADDDDSTSKDFDFNDNSNPKKGAKKMQEYSEAEIRELKANAVKEATDAKDAEFTTTLETEKKKAADDAKKEAQKEFDEQKDEAKKEIQFRSECDKFIDEGLKAKFLTPAMIKAGLKDLLYSLQGTKEIEFKEENGETKKTDSFILLKKILKEYTSASDTEIGEPGDAGDKGGDDANYAAEKIEIGKVLKEFSDQGNKISYGEAQKIAMQNIKERKKAA